MDALGTWYLPSVSLTFLQKTMLKDAQSFKMKVILVASIVVHFKKQQSCTKGTEY